MTCWVWTGKSHSKNVGVFEQEHFHVTAENPNVLLISLNRQVWNDLLSSWQDDGGEIPFMSGTQTKRQNLNHQLCLLPILPTNSHARHETTCQTMPALSQP